MRLSVYILCVDRVETGVLRQRAWDHLRKRKLRVSNIQIHSNKHISIYVFI